MKTSAQWTKHFGVSILDPDGWRPSSKRLGHGDIPDYENDLISEKEYLSRLSISTIMDLTKLPIARMIELNK